MEYIANRLGLVFVKINGPALGHAVTSLDPAEAPNATARQEVEKINLAFEMGNNVMLYLDDIQHTNPEFLQKFISLCDAQRRVEGVWKGRTRTYDLRGKKLRGLHGRQPLHRVGRGLPDPRHAGQPRRHLQPRRHPRRARTSSSRCRYLENSLTSNPVLAPLGEPRARRSLQAGAHGPGEVVQADQLAHAYSTGRARGDPHRAAPPAARSGGAAGGQPAYIDSASQDDAYRTEPPLPAAGQLPQHEQAGREDRARR